MHAKNGNEISYKSSVRVRFSETDPLGIVWHGHYIQYFEDGREAFGREHLLTYLDHKKHGYSCPIVKSSCEHKLPLRYGDVVTIQTTFVDSKAAKMIFRYKIYNSEGKVVCTGETVQVFLNAQGELSLTTPEFFKVWKSKMGLD